MRHGHLFAIKMVTRDGNRATVTWPIDTHRKEALPYVLREVAACLRLTGPNQALVALKTWNRDRLVAHLQQFTQEQLRPPAMRRQASPPTSATVWWR